MGAWGGAWMDREEEYAGSDDDEQRFGICVLGGFGDAEGDIDEFAQHDAALRIDAMISRITDQLAEVATQKPRRVAGQRQARAAPAAAALNPQCGAVIARVLATPRRSAEVRTYVAEHGFGRIPAFVREIEAELDEERKYIVSLPEAREAPRSTVRLLAQGEKDMLVHGLKFQLQRAAADCDQAPPDGQFREELEAEVSRIMQDIESLSRPYIFVEDDR